MLAEAQNYLQIFLLEKLRVNWSQSILLTENHSNSMVPSKALSLIGLHEPTGVTDELLHLISPRRKENKNLSHKASLCWTPQNERIAFIMVHTHSQFRLANTFL